MTIRYNMPKMTEAFTTALKHLETFQPVLITGVLGSGKTHLALDLLATLLDGTDEYDPLILHSPCDLDLLENTPSPAAVLIDDFLGSTGVCQRYLNVLTKYTSLMQRLANRKRLLLIFTVENERLEHLTTEELSFLTDMPSEIVNLSSNEYILSTKTQKKVLHSWCSRFKQPISDEVVNETIRHMEQPDDIGFPALCQLLSTSEFPAIVEDPQDAIDSFITQLESQSPHWYALLTLTAVRGDTHGHFKLGDSKIHLELLQEEFNHYNWANCAEQMKDSLVELKTRGLIEELEKGTVTVPSRLLVCRILYLLLKYHDAKCIRILSVSVIGQLTFTEDDTSNENDTFRPLCVLSPEMTQAIAANINNALETERSEIYQEIASLDVWNFDSFVETVLKIYGHHLYFITDKSDKSLLVYLIQSRQLKAVNSLLQQVNENINLVLGLTAQLEEAKIAAVGCKDEDNLKILFDMCPDITQPLIHKIIELDNVILFQSLSARFNLQSETSVLRTACKYGSYQVLQAHSKGMNNKVLSAELRKKDSDGLTVIHHAASCGDIAVFKYLESLGADIKVKSGRGFTVAHICTMYGHLDLLKYIHERNDELIYLKADHEISCVHVAAMEGHADVLLFLLGSEIDPLILCEDENTVTHIAAVNGRNGILRLVLAVYTDQMFKPNAQTFLPPHLAAKFGQTDTVIFFMKHGVDPDIMTEDSRSLLHLAAFAGHLETVNYFCKFHPRLCKLCDVDGNSVLHDAAAGGDIGVFQKLLETGADPRTPNNDGATVLHDAAFYGRFNIVKHICLTYPELLDTLSRSGLTAAIGAALGGHVNIIEYLENEGTDLTVQTLEGSTALHEASYAGELEMVKHLCNRFPVMQEVRNKRSFMPFHFAAQEGHLDVLRYLLSERIGPTGMLPVTEGCQTILHISAYNGMMDVVKYICTKFPSLLPCKDSEGALALHYAARGGYIQTLDYLIDKGHDPESTTESGSTILHLAAFDGNLNMVTHICELIPDLVSNLDNSGHTAAHYAAGSGKIPVLMNILKYGVDPMIQAENGSTLLMKAAGSGRVSMVKYLCSEYPDMLLIKDYCGCDMLHYAACGGSIDILKLGIDNDLDPLSISAEEHTLLHVATFHNKLNVVLFLSECYPEMIDTVDATQKTPHDIAIELGHGRISAVFQQKKNARTPKTDDTVQDTNGALADVFCMVERANCGGCKSVWGALIRTVCFCRK